jgi:alpha-beta hydrolase superfamily lysophospholipase
MFRRKTRHKRRLIFGLLILFVMANLIAFFHAYKFTHFDTKLNIKTEKPEDLSFGKKIKTLFLGIKNPRPQNKEFPQVKYETINLESNTQIECWDISADSSVGTVVIFHGFSGEKSSMLDKANEFYDMKYNVLLVDFMGSGGSKGNQTTVGFKEAKDVQVCVNYLHRKKKSNIVLYGTSMGAVAIMKAINDYELQVSKIIIECPFGTMLQTVKSRFAEMGVPSFPMAHLLLFWGGLQNGFNAYQHNPTNYAKSINCPTLLLYGEKDIKVSRSEINDIFTNLKGEKYLKTYPESGHENYLIKYKNKWRKDIEEFLKLSKG